MGQLPPVLPADSVRASSASAVAYLLVIAEDEHLALLVMRHMMRTHGGLSPFGGMVGPCRATQVTAAPFVYGNGSCGGG